MVLLLETGCKRSMGCEEKVRGVGRKYIKR